MNRCQLSKHYVAHFLFILSFLCLSIIYLMYGFLQVTSYKYKYIAQNPIGCYGLKGQTLPDISNVSPRKDKSIFFHETSCKSFHNGKITITARQACAVESAAILNPNLDIYLLYSSPGVIKFEGSESDFLLQVLMRYKNVKIMHVNFENYVKNTSVEELFTSGKLKESDFAVEHASHILRYVTLWKYGGIYLDLDTILIRSLENFRLNYVGIKSKRLVGSGVLSFDGNNYGHKLLEEGLKDLKQNFDGKNWIRNGDGVITKLLKPICDVKNVEEMPMSICSGFLVFPKFTFYPIPNGLWRQYFNSSIRNVVELSKNSIALHFWNHRSSSIEIPLNSKTPYLYFAKKYCPFTVNACYKSF